MAFHRSAVQRWLERYVAAWKSYEPHAIADLFSADATYAWHPWEKGDDVARGRDAIVDAWIKNKDAAGTYDAEYAPYAVEGDAAVAVGTSRYFDKHGKLTRQFDNVFLLRFDDEGRCSAFTELFMERPKASAG
jgi:hypothetical protein